MVGGKPRVRARYMRDFMIGVSRLPPEARGAVTARIPSSVVDTIEEAGIMAWLPFEVNLCATHAIYDCLSGEQVHHFFRHLLTTVYGSALFYAYVRTALRTYAAGDPARSARWIPGGLGLLFQHLGSWSAETVAPNESRIGVAGLPHEVDAVWLDSVRHSFYSLFDQVELDGRVELIASDLDAGTASYLMEW